MKNITKALFLAVIGAGLIAPVQAEEVHMIMCGGEIREACLLYTSPSPRDKRQSRMPSSA